MRRAALPLALTLLAACTVEPAPPEVPSTAAPLKPAAPLDSALEQARFVGLVQIVEVHPMRRAITPGGVEGIYSAVTADVLDPVLDRRPDPAARLRFVVIGGQDGEQAMSVTGAPRFRPAERWLLIARDDEPRGWPTWDGTRGAWRVEDGEVFSADRAPLLELDDEGPRFGRPDPAPKVYATRGSLPAEVLRAPGTRPLHVETALRRLRERLDAEVEP